MESPFLSLVLPFYNEEACVTKVIEELRTVLFEVGLPFEIIAVQNGSKDRTSEILEILKNRFKELQVVQVSINQGLGYGILQGLSVSYGEVVGYMSGDGQLDPHILPLLLLRMEETKSDVAIGRRIVRYDGWLRWLISKGCNLLARFLFNIPINDLNGHPKLFTRSTYSLMQLCSHDFFIDPEIVLKAQRLGLQFCEADTEFRRRETGL